MTRTRTRTRTEGIRQGDIPGVQLRCRQVLALPREQAWVWLTEPGHLGRWLAEEVQGETGVGGTLRLTGRDEKGHDRREEIRIVTWEPPRLQVAAFERLDAGWTSATRLTVEVFPRPEGCEISVLQDGFQNLSLSTGLTVWEEYRRRWRTALARLGTRVAAAARPPGPDPGGVDDRWTIG